MKSRNAGIPCDWHPLFQIPNSSPGFASVLFDFDLREWLVKQTDAKLLTSELAILQIDRPLVGKKAPQLCSFIHEETFVAACHGIL